MRSLFLFAFLLAFLPVNQASGQRIRRPDSRRVHDPSTVLKEGEHSYFFCTGHGITLVRELAKDDWHHAGRVFTEEAIPSWHKEKVPGARSHLWAPDVIQLGDTYYLYYSVSTFGSQTSAIGLTTGKSLDPDSPDWNWTDQGAVITSSRGSPFNAIDPALFKDDDGSLWMSFGSFWEGLYLVSLNPKTGLRKDEKKKPVPLAKAGQIEAPFITRRGDFYYLFLNHGLCCRGTQSTYRILVGRSKSLTGPYRDQTGQDLRQGGGTLLLETDGRQIGPGHASIFKRDEKEYLSYHYYDRDDRGISRFAFKELTWSEEGWPRIKPAKLKEEPKTAD